MRTTSILTVVALAATVTLTGCTASAQPDVDHLPDSAPVATSTPTPTATTDATYGDRIINDRGNLVKQIGQLSGITTAEGSDVTLAQFVVTDIVVDLECTSGFDSLPTNGHYVGVHLNVESTPELAEEDYPSLSFSEWAWEAFDDSGKRVNDPMGSAWTCLDGVDSLPSDIGPAESVSGWIVLDLPTTTGSVVFTMGAPTGWEWAY